MLDRVELQKIFDAMPWPQGTKPHMRYQTDGRQFAILLHETVSNGWHDIVQAVGVSPEGALRTAVEGWLTQKKPMNSPEFHDLLRRTWN